MKFIRKMLIRMILFGSPFGIAGMALGVMPAVLAWVLWVGLPIAFCGFLTAGVILARVAKELPPPMAVPEPKVPWQNLIDAYMADDTSTRATHDFVYAVAAWPKSWDELFEPDTQR